MAGTEQELTFMPYMVYEHRDKEGNLISKGKHILRRGNRLHLVQENDKGKKMAESMVAPDGRVLEEIIYDQKGKKASHFKFLYDEKGNISKEEVKSKWLL